jgi:hypothetical protein
MTGDQPDGALTRCPGPPAAAEVPLVVYNRTLVL